MSSESPPEESSPEESSASESLAEGSSLGNRHGEDRSRAQLSRPAVGRLSLYFRELHRLKEAGTETINSRTLGQLVNVSAAILRRDLSTIGTSGRRGVGYGVEELLEQIGKVLGSGQRWEVVLIGAGSLGDALLRYRGFSRLGFKLTTAFDINPARIGTVVGGVPIHDAAEMRAKLSDQPPHLAILAIPAEQAVEVANQLVSMGVSGLLNFAPVTLKLGSKVAVVNVDLASELQRLAFAVQTQ